MSREKEPIFEGPNKEEPKEPIKEGPEEPVEPVKDTKSPLIQDFNISPSFLSVPHGKSSTVTITVDVIDTESGISSVTLNGSNITLLEGNTYGTTKTYLYNSSYAGTTKTETYTIVASDGANNLSESVKNISIAYEPVPDNIIPTITSFSSNVSNVLLLTNSQTQTVTFTASLTDNIGITSVSFEGLTPSISGNNYTWTKTYNYHDYSSGETTDNLTLTVSDAAGNVNNDTINILIEKIIYNYTVQDNIPYYIEATVNLNDNVSLVNGNTGINGGFIRHVNTHYNINYNLPTGNTIITMMNFNAKHNNTLLNTYSLDVNVTVDQIGTLSTSHEIKGTDTIGYIQDTAGTVNYAYWDVDNVPTLNVDQVDKLSAILTPSKIESGNTDAINSVLATYEGISVLQSWTIQLSSIIPSLSNFINQYRLSKNRPINRVFENGEQVVLSTTQDYSVVIHGVDGSSHTLVSPTPIKAIITHQDTAPQLERV